MPVEIGSHHQSSTHLAAEWSPDRRWSRNRKCNRGYSPHRIRIHQETRKYLTPWVKEVLASAQKEQEVFEEEKQSFKQRLPIIWREALKILRGVLPYVIIGIAIGGLMHGYIPSGFFEKYMAKDTLFAVPLATLLSVPMYSNASGILPVVQVLVDKGIPLGTAIAFMMGVVGLSLPEAMLLKKVMTLKLIGIFFGVVMLCIMVSGYLFNIIL